MGKPKPVFSDRVLSGKKSLDQLGITEADAEVPEGWKREQGAGANCDSNDELGKLFASHRIRAALRQALRRMAQPSP